ncbi:MAG: hypothetical protein CM15mP49_13340 [Actinomycetota bacterium]|nr:MAG: hypothetical protein CM15mP49_13340 [Actinomycetota bacterium]
MDERRNEADYVWLACRTDHEAKKHKGISIIIVPTDDPGFSYTPIVTCWPSHNDSNLLRRSRVPYSNLVGDLHGGWGLIASQLNHERVGLAAVSVLSFRLFDDVVEWAATTNIDDETRIMIFHGSKWTLRNAKAKLDALNLMNWRMTTAVEAGTLSHIMHRQPKYMEQKASQMSIIYCLESSEQQVI